MIILSDTNIPAVEQAFGRLGEVRTIDGREIIPPDLREVDVLLVRSVTRVDRALLQKSPVKFVGSATSGTDHVNIAQVAEHGAQFAHASGSNAESVAEYVIAALLHLSVQQSRPLSGMKMGVVGCGNVGSIVCERATALGLTMLPCDPPLAQRQDPPEGTGRWYSWQEVVPAADVLTLHVPLTSEGKHPTHHLISRDELGRMKPDAWLINTSRGAVIDTYAMTEHLTQHPEKSAVLDVWENEPSPSSELIQSARLATPHIAGYSFDGKLRGTQMLYNAVMEWLGETPSWSPADFFEETPETLEIPGQSISREARLNALIRQVYDIRHDDAHLRQIAHLPENQLAEAFSSLRKSYRRRRSFSAYQIPESASQEELVMTFQKLAGYSSNG